MIHVGGPLFIVILNGGPVLAVNGSCQCSCERRSGVLSDVQIEAERRADTGQLSNQAIT